MVLISNLICSNNVTVTSRNFTQLKRSSFQIKLPIFYGKHTSNYLVINLEVGEGMVTSKGQHHIFLDIQVIRWPHNTVSFQFYIIIFPPRFAVTIFWVTLMCITNKVTKVNSVKYHKNPMNFWLCSKRKNLHTFLVRLY